MYVCIHIVYVCASRTCNWLFSSPHPVCMRIVYVWYRVCLRITYMYAVTYKISNLLLLTCNCPVCMQWLKRFLLYFLFVLLAIDFSLLWISYVCISCMFAHRVQICSKDVSKKFVGKFRRWHSREQIKPQAWKYLWIIWRNNQFNKNSLKM